MTEIDLAKEIHRDCCPPLKCQGGCLMLARRQIQYEQRMRLEIREVQVRFIWQLRALERAGVKLSKELPEDLAHRLANETIEPGSAKEPDDCEVW